MPRALKVTEENLDKIVADAKMLKFNLDYLKDTLDYYRECGNIYLITDGTPEDNNITFTTFTEPDFRHLWKFKSAEMPTEFVEIERV